MTTAMMTPLQKLRAAHREELAHIKTRHKEEKDALAAKMAAEKARIKAEKQRVLAEKKAAAQQRKIVAQNKPCGDVTIHGETHPLTKAQKDVLQARVGARAGRFKVDGKAAVMLLDAIDPHGTGGDVIIVRYKGRKTEMVFRVGDAFLTWETRTIGAQKPAQSLAA